MQAFRKIPVVIEAIQVLEENLPEIMALPNVHKHRAAGLPQWNLKGIYIQTLEGRMTVSPNDWIIKGVAGEIYPCKPDIFEATYEPVPLASS